MAVSSRFADSSNQESGQPGKEEFLLSGMGGVGGWFLFAAITLTYSTCALAADKDIEARSWLNNPPYRLHDDRTVILFFFKCGQSESAEWARRLRDVSRRPSTLVIGLTEDSRSAATRFVEQYHVSFAVGAGSQSAKVFGVQKFPSLLLVKPGAVANARSVDIASLASELPAWHESLENLQDEESLRSYIESDANGPSRAAALDKLWKTLGPQRQREMVDLAQSRLTEESDPWVRGFLRYYQDVGQGLQRTDRQSTASAQYYREFRQKPDDPKWAGARAIQRESEKARPSELLNHYNAHRTNNPDDVLIRRLVVLAMGKGAAERASDGAYRGEVRAALFEILPSESDASIRMLAVIGLGKAAVVGDIEVAGYLETLAPNERDDFRVRPMMEYVAHYLRTGTTSAPAPSAGP